MSVMESCKETSMEFVDLVKDSLPGDEVDIKQAVKMEPGLNGIGGCEENLEEDPAPDLVNIKPVFKEYSNEIKTEEVLEEKTVILVPIIKSESEMKQFAAELKIKKEDICTSELDDYKITNLIPVVKIKRDPEIEHLVSTQKVKQEEIGNTELDDCKIKDWIPVVKIKQDPGIQNSVSPQEDEQIKSLYNNLQEVSYTWSENVICGSYASRSVPDFYKCLHPGAEILSSENVNSGIV